MDQNPLIPPQEPTIPVSQPFQPPTQAASQPFYPPPPPPPPSGYYPAPSQPFYQLPPQPIRKSNNGLKIAALAIIFVICIVATAAIAYQVGKNSVSQSPTGGSTTGNSANTQNTPGSGTTPVSTTAPGQQHYKIGDQVHAADWLIVLNSAMTSTGDDVFQPSAGDIFVDVDLSLQNQATTSQDMNIFDFTLRSSDGTPYMAALSDLPDITGTIVAGGKDHGGIAFEVPQADKTFTLEFVPDFESVAAIWNISV